MNWRQFFFPERPRSTWFARTFGPKMVISLGAKDSTFQVRGQTLRIPSVIYIEEHDRIASVGQRPINVVPRSEEWIFDPAIPEDRRELLLERFLHFGIWKALDRSITIRPNVTVHLAVEFPKAKLLEILNRVGAGATSVQPA